jgi:uncharacterized protein (TIGR03089 family)
VPTYADLLTSQLRRDPGRPFVTFYDATSGERTELSLTTYANWVAKAANLLTEELDLAPDDVLLLDLPCHWLGPVFLGAAWTVGLEVAFPGGTPTADAVVCGPDGLATWGPRAGALPVVASALHPLGLRFAEELPDGVHDLGVEIWSQPDAFLGVPATGPSEPDWGAAASGTLLPDGGRLLSTVNPASPPGLPVLCEPLARGGSLVLVVGADADRLESIATDERVTARHHAS